VQFVTANGATIPALGFGTYGMPRSDMLRMIPAALNAGFRHFDTAQNYRNEAELVECVAASGLKRGRRLHDRASRREARSGFQIVPSLESRILRRLDAPVAENATLVTTNLARSQGMMGVIRYAAKLDPD
jgi:hypothetical protein